MFTYSTNMNDILLYMFCYKCNSLMVTQNSDESTLGRARYLLSSFQQSPDDAHMPILGSHVNGPSPFFVWQVQVNAVLEEHCYALRISVVFYFILIRLFPVLKEPTLFLYSYNLSSSTDIWTLKLLNTFYSFYQTPNLCSRVHEITSRNIVVSLGRVSLHCDS